MKLTWPFPKLISSVFVLSTVLLLIFGHEYKLHSKYEGRSTKTVNFWTKHKFLDKINSYFPTQSALNSIDFVKHFSNFLNHSE